MCVNTWLFIDSRYHTDEEQKFPHVQPGKISDRLRKAMGLRPDQAPPYIYRMRELGYPPGWVEEAKVSHSGLTMFVSDGQGKLILCFRGGGFNLKLLTFFFFIFRGQGPRS